MRKSWDHCRLYKKIIEINVEVNYNYNTLPKRYLNDDTEGGVVMRYEITSEKYAQDVVKGSLYTMSRNADGLMRIFAESVMKNTIPETWNFYKSGMDQLEALSNYLQINASDEKQRVYYFAVMKTVLELGDMLNRKLEEYSELQMYKNYKYIYPILEILADSGGLSVCRLAEKLDVSRNSLSNSFRRTDKFGLWRMESRGKSHYYYITAKGKRVYQHYCIQNSGQSIGRDTGADTNHVEKTVLYVLDLVGSEMEKENPNPSHIVHLMNQKFDKGISVASSEVFRVKLKEVFLKSEMGIYKRRRRNRHLEKETSGNFLERNIYEEEYYAEDMGGYQYGMAMSEEVY